VPTQATCQAVRIGSPRSGAMRLPRCSASGQLVTIASSTPSAQAPINSRRASAGERSASSPPEERWPETRGASERGGPAPSATPGGRGAGAVCGGVVAVCGPVVAVSGCVVALTLAGSSRRSGRGRARSGPPRGWAHARRGGRPA
jgi:hypothetical protein